MVSRLMPTALAVALILSTQAKGSFIPISSYSFTDAFGSNTATKDPLISFASTVSGTGLGVETADTNGIRRSGFDNNISHLDFNYLSATPTNYSIDRFVIYGRINSTGAPPTQLEVLVSTNNFASSFSLGTFNPSTTDSVYSNFLGSPLVFNNFTGTIAFRIVATSGNFGGGNSADWFQISNGLGFGGTEGIQIGGTVQAVPEPSSMALLGLSLGAMGAYARRRMKKTQTPVETEATV